MNDITPSEAILLSSGLAETIFKRAENILPSGGIPPFAEGD